MALKHLLQHTHLAALDGRRASVRAGAPVQSAKPNGPRLGLWAAGCACGVQEAPAEWVLEAFENDHAFVRTEELCDIRVWP